MYILMRSWIPQFEKCDKNLRNCYIEYCYLKRTIAIVLQQTCLYDFNQTLSVTCDLNNFQDCRCYKQSPYRYLHRSLRITRAILFAYMCTFWVLFCSIGATRHFPFFLHVKNSINCHLFYLLFGLG